MEFSNALRKKCPYLNLFWSTFSCIRTEYGEILSISPYSGQLRENADQNNSVYGHFSGSDELSVFAFGNLKGRFEPILSKRWLKISAIELSFLIILPFTVSEFGTVSSLEFNVTINYVPYHISLINFEYF